MPTNRTKIKRSANGDSRGISKAMLNFLETGGSGDDSEMFIMSVNVDAVRSEWDIHKDDVMNNFEQCSRPWAWWRDAEPRRRIGGTGTPSSDVLAYAPSFEYGIPGHWVKPFDVAYYNGRFKDVDGKKVGSFQEGDFTGRAIDPGDPPRFESQAVYLQRLGLLTATERAYLKRHPELMAPEAVTT
jgi:hypothetical protein